MFIVLNSFAVLYLNLIGQNKYSCQTPDQAKALLERGQIGHKDLILTTLLNASGQF